MPGLPRFDFYPRDWLTGTRILSLEARALYADFLALLYDAGEALPFDARLIAKLTGIHWRTVGKALAELIERGKVTVTENGKLTNARFEKELQKARERHARKNGHAPSLPQSCADPAPSLTPSKTPQEISKPLKSKETRPPPPSPPPSPPPKEEERPPPSPPGGDARELSLGAKRLALDREFDLTFWPLYPIKNGRKEALRAFHVARAKVALAVIMAGLESYRVMLKAPNAPQPKYAQGWLNGERWNDENTPQNGVRNDRRNGTATDRKLGPGDATFAGFAIALDRAEQLDREREQAADRRADSGAAQPLLATQRHAGSA